MKTFRKLPFFLWVAILILFLIKTDLVVAGAKSGLELCTEAIIPTIFPILFISMILSSSNTSFQALEPICKALGIPNNAQHILLLALVGGYPIGAQAVADAERNRLISKSCAVRLLAFCNNAGPSFIFGLLHVVITKKYATLLLWIIHIGSALLTGLILPDKDPRVIGSPIEVKYNITIILKRSIFAIATICGWVILFRILCLFIIQIGTPSLSPMFLAALNGLFELSNGCMYLRYIEDEYIRFIMAALMLSFSGICILLQTRSVTNNLPLKMLVKGKLMQMIYSVTLAINIVPLFYHIRIHSVLRIICLALCIIISIVIRKKSSSNMYENVV